jgi:uncharacterized protein
MSTSDEQKRLVADLKEALLETYDLEAIILFGSMGRGDADEFSDVDLLVVMETDQDVKRLSEEMTRYLDPLVRDKHIIVKTARDFCRQRDIPGTIVYSAAKEGLVLFERKGWENAHLPEESYERRKQEVIQLEYVQSALDFLAKAESSLKEGSFFRARDFARFSAARALKGVFVTHDMHPPRETGLEMLFDQAEKMEPAVARERDFVRELNRWSPLASEGAENRRSDRMVEETGRFVRTLISRLERHQESAWS